MVLQLGRVLQLGMVLQLVLLRYVVLPLQQQLLQQRHTLFTMPKLGRTTECI